MSTCANNANVYTNYYVILQKGYLELASNTKAKKKKKQTHKSCTALASFRPCPRPRGVYVIIFLSAIKKLIFILAKKPKRSERQPALSYLNVILNNRNRFCGFMLHLPFDKRQPDIAGWFLDVARWGTLGHSGAGWHLGARG